MLGAERAMIDVVGCLFWYGGIGIYVNGEEMLRITFGGGCWYLYVGKPGVDLPLGVSVTSLRSGDLPIYRCYILLYCYCYIAL